MCQPESTRMFKKFLFLLITLLFFSFFSIDVSAQEKEEVLEGLVTKVLEQELPYQKLEVLITKGSLLDQKIQVETGKLAAANQPVFKKGDELLLSYSEAAQGKKLFYITDFIRRRPLFWLAFVFILLTCLVAGWQGASSLFSMAISFLVIFKFILPQILAGHEPVFIAICGSLAILPPIFYLSHGFNKKTTVALLSTFISLLLTGFLAHFSVQVSKLSGFVSEEAAFLQTFTKGEVNIKGLLLAGIIISVLGVLDDITVSQSAVVKQLTELKKRLSFEELFKRAMSVGKDHIASMVNTLILVYTGASLPLLLLFVNNQQHPFSEIINYEIVAEEIIKILVASIGLILAVPITTFLASFFFQKTTT